MSQIGPLLSPLLVGRDDLLNLADRRLAEAAEGNGQLLLLAGQAGVGKSRLLQVILRKARTSGFKVARADLAPQDLLVPLGSILDLVRTMRMTAGFRELGDDVFTRRDGGASDSLATRRLLVHDVAERIIDAIDGPALLAFEDIQWADELSLEVIGDLARLIRDRPILLIAAYRIDELPIGSIHREWRARLLSQRFAEEARLEPLTYEQTALVTTLILDTGLPAPRDVVDAVYQRTDGIPLHIEELLGALGEAARSDDRAIRNAKVPETIEDAILARVARLSPEARAVASAGAVIGRCFMPDVLAGVMDKPVADLDGALEELTANAFLFSFGVVDEGYYDFRHQLLRDALYRSVPAADLRRLHARAGEFGAALIGADVIHASVHFERAGLRAEAYRTALEGARAASAVSSRRESYELYRRAVANAPADLAPAELASLYAAMSEAAAAMDQSEVAMATSEAARGYFLAAGDPTMAAEQLMFQAMMKNRDARPMAERNALLEQARAEIDAQRVTTDREIVRGEILLVQAINDVWAGRLDVAQAQLEEGLEIARAVADESLEMDAQYFLNYADAVRSRSGGGLARVIDTARRARDAGYEATGVTAYRNASIMAVRLMDYDGARNSLREGLRYADEIEQSYCRRLMAATSAMIAWTSGDWASAVSLAEMELVERGSMRGSLGSRDALGFVAFGRGDVNRARTLLGDSLAVGRDSGEIALVLPALWGLAETALVAGEPAAAIDLCREALEAATAAQERGLLVPFVVTGVRAHLAAQRPDEAERWAERIASALGDWGGPADVAQQHAAGLLSLAAGSSVAARGAFESAVDGWEAIGRIWESTWARLDLVAALVRANRHVDAAPVLREARERSPNASTARPCSAARTSSARSCAAGGPWTSRGGRSPCASSRSPGWWRRA